jgi:hypothetical protein
MRSGGSAIIFTTASCRSWVAEQIVPNERKCAPAWSSPYRSTIAWRTFAPIASVKESKGGESAEEMLRQLVLGQESVVRTAREVFPVVDKNHDEPTADLLTQRMQTHEKNAWMLRSMLA